MAFDFQCVSYLYQLHGKKSKLSVKNWWLENKHSLNDEYIECLATTKTCNTAYAADKYLRLMCEKNSESPVPFCYNLKDTQLEIIYDICTGKKQFLSDNSRIKRFIEFEQNEEIIYLLHLILFNQLDISWWFDIKENSEIYSFYELLVDDSKSYYVEKKNLSLIYVHYFLMGNFVQSPFKWFSNLRPWSLELKSYEYLKNIIETNYRESKYVQHNIELVSKFHEVFLFFLHFGNGGYVIDIINWWKISNKCIEFKNYRDNVYKIRNEVKFQRFTELELFILPILILYHREKQLNNIVSWWLSIETRSTIYENFIELKHIC